jgi:hypothetical protein
MFLKDPETDRVAAEDGWVETGTGALVCALDVPSIRPSLADADYECIHGRLAGDVCPSPRVRFTSGEFAGVVQNWPHPHPCECWPQEQPMTGTPDLMGALRIPKETDVTDVTETEEAPYGRKADGTPRKRPAPSAEQIAAQQVGRQQAKERRAREAASDPLSTPVAQRASAVTPHPTFARLVAELDGEIARLTKARDYLRELAA